MGAAQSSTSSSCNDTSARTSESNDGPQPYGVSATTTSFKVNNSFRTLYDGLLLLVEDNSYADLVVICGDDRYPVHRAIVCPRSAFFREQCALQYGERDYASPSKPTKIWIDPSECESRVLAAVFAFLYTLDYKAVGKQCLTFGIPEDVEEDEEEESEDNITSGVRTPETVTPSCHQSETGWINLDDVESEPELDLNETNNELVFHLLVLKAACHFGVKALVDVAKHKFVTRLRAVQATPEMIGCLRRLHADSNEDSLKEVKELAIERARANIRALRTFEDWHDLVIDFPEFGAEMLKRLNLVW